MPNMSKRLYSLPTSLSETKYQVTYHATTGYQDAISLDPPRPRAAWAILAHWKTILQAATMVYLMGACTVLLVWRTSEGSASPGGSGSWLRGTGEGPAPDSVSVAMLSPDGTQRRTLDERQAGAGGARLGNTLPEGFDWEAYLWWNADVRAAGYDTRDKAEQHFLNNGQAELRLHKRARITLRYTACGGLFNQHYCHLSAAALAVLAGATDMQWPPMQERASFSKRFSKDPEKNMQTWQYVDAETLWDIPKIQENMQKRFNLTVAKHPDNCAMPNFTQPLTAYQECPLLRNYDLHVQLEQVVYIARIAPEALRDRLFSTIQLAYMRKGGGEHPLDVLVDLPCTLFMMELRHLPLVEDIAKNFAWAPRMQALADKVVRKIRAEANAALFNGIHLRMEKDAVDWAINTGGPEHYWDAYKAVMAQARFNVDPKALYVASGLLKSGVDDDWSRMEFERLSEEIISLKYATAIVHKEMYLGPNDLAGVLNEQSALIDFLVLRQAWSVVGVGMSTFSFYLKEDRLMDGRDPRDMSMLMMPSIGTDELFFSAAVVAVKTRAKLMSQNRLNEVCQRANLEPCFSR